MGTVKEGGQEGRGLGGAVAGRGGVLGELREGQEGRREGPREKEREGGVV